MTAIANARVVTTDAVFAGSIRIADGRIAAIDEGRSVPAGAVDFEGDYLLPGLVELHTDNMERHFMPRPGVDWPGPVAAAAHDAQIAASGITTVFDAVAIGDIFDRSGRIRQLDGMLDAIRRGQAEGRFRVEHRLHLRCEICCPDVVAMFEPHAGDPLVGLVSLMDHTPGQRQFVKVEKYRQYYQGKYGFSDAEMEAFIARQIAAQGLYGAQNRARLLDLCRSRGLPLASHDDATPEHVAEAVADGLVLAEFPTTVAAAEAARAAGLRVLMGAPNVVLGGSHSGNVSAADLAEAGLLDILSSDYVPASLLQAAFQLAGNDDGPTLPEAVRTVSRTPAEAVGFDDRGAIAPGLRADLIRVRPMPGGPVVVAVWRGGERVA